MVRFRNARIPIPATGFLQICKVAGAGVVNGTNFVFMVAGIPVTVPAGLAPGGDCSAAFVEPAGSVTITETLLSGTVLTAVTTLPSGLLVASDLAAGTATVTVENGGQTTVTFVDTIPAGPPTTGVLQICKVAGAGIAVGTKLHVQRRGNSRYRYGRSCAGGLLQCNAGRAGRARDHPGDTAVRHRADGRHQLAGRVAGQ